MFNRKLKAYRLNKFNCNSEKLCVDSSPSNSCVDPDPRRCINL